MGLLIMLSIIILFAFVLNLFIDTYLAIVFAVIFFIVWYKYNQRAGTVGLFNSNLSAY